MKRKKLVVLLLLVLSVAQAYDQEPIALVVPANGRVSNISMKQLRDLFQCESSSWPSGHPKLFSRASGTPEHTAMLREIYRMTESDYQQMWVMKQIRGESWCKPIELPSKGMTLEALRAFPGALVLIRSSEVTPEMKVLAVDGLKPESSGYPLR